MTCSSLESARPLLAILLFILMGFSAVPTAEASHISILPGQSIQQAINSALPGDVIEIQPGSYRESIIINKSLILRGAETAGGGRPLLTAEDGGSAIRITAEGAKVEGMDLFGATDWSGAAVLVTSRNCIIANNTMQGNAVGILISSDGNTVVGNEVDDNYLGGLVIFSSRDNHISDNSFCSNNQAGIIAIDSEDNLIVNNNASENMGIAIKLYQSQGNVIKDNLMITNDYGIVLSNSSNNTVHNNSAINNDYGFYPYRSRGNAISNNTASENDYAIYLWDSCGNLVADNDLEDNDGSGITLFFSHENRLEGNNAGLNEQYGIHLISSNGNLMQRNIFSNISAGSGAFFEDSSANNFSFNQVNTNFDKGLQMVASSRNILEGNAFRGNREAIAIMGVCEGNSLSRNQIVGGDLGIVLRDVCNGTISENALHRISAAAIRLNSSTDISINGNDIDDCPTGVLLDNSSVCTLLENRLDGCSHAVSLLHSCNISLTGNEILLGETAIRLDGSANNSIKSNDLSLNVDGIMVEDSMQNNLENNTIQSKNIGIGITASSGCNITGNEAAGCHQGIRLIGSGNNQVSFNNISFNYEGLSLDEGVYPQHSSGNQIYLNTFMGNSRDVHSFISTNTWTSPQDISYRFQGRTLSSRLGNLWAGSSMEDGDRDGISDDPHNIGLDEDDRPLMQSPFLYSAIG